MWNKTCFVSEYVCIRVRVSSEHKIYYYNVWYETNSIWLLLSYILENYTQTFWSPGDFCKRALTNKICDKKKINKHFEISMQQDIFKLNFEYFHSVNGKSHRFVGDSTLEMVKIPHFYPRSSKMQSKYFSRFCSSWSCMSNGMMEYCWVLR